MIAIIESPYAGEVEENLTYLRACMADAFSKGEFPICSHGLYTQPGVLDDKKPEERKKGIKAGFMIWEALETSGRDVRRVFYLDRGWSGGMRDGLEHALQIGQRIEFRSLSKMMVLPDGRIVVANPLRPPEVFDAVKG